MSTRPISDRGRIIQAIDALETRLLRYFNAAGDLTEKERRGGDILQLFIQTNIAGQNICPKEDILGLNCPTGQRCVGGVCTGGGYSGLGELSDEEFMKGMVAALREDLLKFYDSHSPSDLSATERADQIVSDLEKVIIARS